MLGTIAFILLAVLATVLMAPFVRKAEDDATEKFFEEHFNSRASDKPKQEVYADDVTKWVLIGVFVLLLVVIVIGVALGP